MWIYILDNVDYSVDYGILQSQTQIQHYECQEMKQIEGFQIFDHSGGKQLFF